MGPMSKRDNASAARSPGASRTASRGAANAAPPSVADNRALFPAAILTERPWAWAVALAAVICVGGALQWPLLNNDVVERVHGWRQAQTDMTSRNFARDGMNPLVARVDYIGDGQMQLELPVYQYLTAICYRLFGVAPVWGRLVAMLFGAGSAIVLYQIGAMLWSRRAGLLAAGVFTFSPLDLYFNRAIMPDSGTICFTLLSLWCFLRFFRDGRRRDLILAAATIFLALAGKPPIVVTVFPPLAVAALLSVGWRVWRRPDLLIALAVAALLFGGWMKYQSYVNNQRSDNLGIEFTNAGEFNQDLMFWYFGDAKQRSDPRTYRRIWSRLHDWLGHPAPGLAHRADQRRIADMLRRAGRPVPQAVAANAEFGAAGAAAETVARYYVVALCLIGIGLSWRMRMQWILPAWALGSLAYVLIFLNVNYVHNYYQMPLIPMFALAAAVGLDRLLAGAERLLPASAAGGRTFAGAAPGGAVVALFLAVQAWGGFAVLRDYDGHPNHETWKPGERAYTKTLQQHIDFGRLIHDHLPDNGGLLALAGDGFTADVRDPQMLFYVDRRGFHIQAPVKGANAPRDKNAWVRDHFPQIMKTVLERQCRTLVVVNPALLLTPAFAADLGRRFKLHYREPSNAFVVFDLMQTP